MATVRVFNHHVHTSFYWLAAIDVALFVLAFYAGTYIQCFIELEPASFKTHLSDIPGRAISFGAVSLVCLGAMGLYEPRMREGRSGILIRTIGGFSASLLVVSCIFLLLPDFSLWSGVLLYAAAYSLLQGTPTHSLLQHINQEKSVRL